MLKGETKISTKLKVLVVDNSVNYRRLISKAVEETGMAVVKHTASNGILALERLSQDSYDVVLMDVIIPQLDGISTLEVINKQFPELPVIMISEKLADPSLTVKALSMGALDFIIKPEEVNTQTGINMLKNYLSLLFTGIRIQRASKGYSKKLANVIDDLLGSTSISKHIIPCTKKTPQVKIEGIDYILIASSTGGPAALETVISNLSVSLKKVVLVVQHMPSNFTKVLAENLDKKSPMEVLEGQDGLISKKNQIIIAPGGLHTLVKRTNKRLLSIQLQDTPPVNGVKPSADVLFKSFANEFKGSRVLTVILTGMGRDGKEGVLELKEKCRCYCITQSQKTSVIYGMPKSVREAGLSDEELDLDMIAKRIMNISLHGSC